MDVPATHPVHGDRTPWVDRSGPVWIGCLPDLGQVRVHPDGTVDVDLTDGPDLRRDQALRLGWGEPLSLVRRGHHLAWGTTLTRAGRAMLVSGDAAETAAFTLPLLADGWGVLADGLAPLDPADGGWTAYPRQAPPLTPRRVARHAGTAGRPARAGSDAWIVDGGTDGSGCLGPCPLTAVVQLSRRTRQDRAALTPVSGSARLRLASALLCGGVLAVDHDPEPGALLSLHLSLARIPAARVPVDAADPGDAVDAALAWLGTVAP